MAAGYYPPFGGPPRLDVPQPPQVWLHPTGGGVAGLPQPFAPIFQEPILVPLQPSPLGAGGSVAGLGHHHHPTPVALAPPQIDTRFTAALAPVLASAAPPPHAPHYAPMPGGTADHHPYLPAQQPQPQQLLHQPSTSFAGQMPQFWPPPLPTSSSEGHHTHLAQQPPPPMFYTFSSTTNGTTPATFAPHTTAPSHGLPASAGVPPATKQDVECAAGQKVDPPGSNTSRKQRAAEAASTPSAGATPTTGAQSSVKAPSADALNSLVDRLQAGLVPRPIDESEGPTTVLPEESLRELLSLCYTSFSTDRDLMTFCKTRLTLEMSMQLRDFLVADHLAVLKRARNEGGGGVIEEAASVPTSAFAHDIVEWRGIVVVSLADILSVLPTPCANGELPKNRESAASVARTGFCPLAAQVLDNAFFPRWISTQRGCIAVIRLATIIHRAPRPAAQIILLATRHMRTMLFDKHANYVLSTILCNTEESSEVYVYEPLDNEAMVSRTTEVLSLGQPTGSGGSATTSEGSPSVSGGSESGRERVVRRARVKPQYWRRFLTEMLELFTEDIVASTTRRESAQVLVQLLKRLPLPEVPEMDAIPLAMVGSDEVLDALLRSPAGRQCLLALTDTVAVKQLQLGEAVVAACRTLCDRLRDPRVRKQFTTLQQAQLVSVLRCLPFTAPRCT